MEFLIGLTGKDFVLVATDVLNVRSIMVLSQDMKKAHSLSTHQVLCASGESGEVARLQERLQAETALSQFRMGRAWSTKETAWFTRSLLAENLRTRNPYQCEILIAGVDEEPTLASPNASSLTTLESTITEKKLIHPIASLYWIDHMGSLLSLPYAAHGYGAFFTWGLLDARYKADMTLDEAVRLLAFVIKEMRTRFIIQLPRLSFTLIDAEGTKEIILDGNIDDADFNWNITQQQQSMEAMTISA